MLSYIDIHSHHLHNSPEVLSILNLRAGEELPATEPLHVSYGVHPWDADKPEKTKLLDDIFLIKNLLAIGECGMDKLRGPNLELQKNLFIKHVAISEQIHKPVIIHCVGYFNELIALRKKNSYSQQWIIHGFRGHPQLARQLIDCGILLSFGEALFRANSKAIQALQTLQAEQWFLETDESKLPIKLIYQRAAEICQLSIEELLEQQHKNFISTFIA